MTTSILQLEASIFATWFLARLSSDAVRGLQRRFPILSKAHHNDLLSALIATAVGIVFATLI